MVDSPVYFKNNASFEISVYFLNTLNRLIIMKML